MCAKGLFNGPCGGTNKGMCEVSKDQPCAWHMIYERLKKQGRLDCIKDLSPYRSGRTRSREPSFNRDTRKPEKQKEHAHNQVCQQGTSSWQNTEMKSGSRLEKILRAGHFAFTGELGPPRGANAEAVRKRRPPERQGRFGQHHRQPDRCGAHGKLGRCLILLQEGIEPNYQMVCRDRNRLAMQSDILGAYAHGIRNILCLSGDHPKFGDQPNAKGVFDIDSMQLINMVKFMRDDKKFLSGTELDEPPRMFIGAAQPLCGTL
jgi:hypothetical protein